MRASALMVVEPGDMAGLDHAQFERLQLRLRSNPRARRLRLSVRQAQVELMIAPGFSAASINAFVDQHRHWIIRQQQTQKGELGRAEAALSLELDAPRVPIWGVSLPIRLIAGAPPSLQLGADAVEIGLDARRGNAQKALGRILRAGLGQLLRERMQKQLPALQQRLGDRCSALRIRPLRSLWGSLSARGAISLNLGLVFLPAALADYVLAHELAHLRQHNHSPAFWREVASLYPQWQIARARLRSEHAYVQALLDRLNGA